MSIEHALYSDSLDNIVFTCNSAILISVPKHKVKHGVLKNEFYQENMLLSICNSEYSHLLTIEYNKDLSFLLKNCDKFELSDLVNISDIYLLACDVAHVIPVALSLNANKIDVSINNDKSILRFVVKDVIIYIAILKNPDLDCFHKTILIIKK